MNKPFFTLALGAALLAGCQPTGAPTTTRAAQPTTLSAAEKATAVREISARLEEVIAGAKALDLDAAIKPYSRDTSFRIVSPDARVSDYESMKSEQKGVFDSVKNLGFTTARQRFVFLTNDLVLCTWTGRYDFELKTGEKMRIEPYTGSMLFGKKGGEWKIRYAHESAGQPVRADGN
mgnify:CR=1 FL=1